MSQCPHCWWRPPHTGAGLRGEPVKGAGHRGCQGEPVCPIPAQRWRSDSTGQGVNHEEQPGLDTQAVSPCPAGEVTGQTALGALKTAFQKHAGSCGFGVFLCVFFPLKYLVAGHKSICCSREKSI